MGLSYDPNISAALLGMNPERLPHATEAERRCTVALAVQAAVSRDSRDRQAARAARLLIDEHEHDAAVDALSVTGGGASSGGHLDVAAALNVTPEALALWRSLRQPSESASADSAWRAMV